MRKSHFKNTSSRIEQYLSGIDRAQTTREIAEFLGVATSSIHGTLQLMEVFGTVQKVKRGSYYYFLKEVYDDEQISAMLPPERVKPKPRRRRSILPSPRRSEYPVRKSFLEEHLSTMRAQASSGEGPSALAMIGLNNIDVAKDDVVPAEVVLRHLDVEVEVEEEKLETPIKIEPFATVEHLPKDVTQLTLGQTRHIKEQLKVLDGYERIERFKTAFAEFSSLKNGSYGTLFYFSAGTNPWEKVYKVTVDDSISLEMEKPVKMLRGKRRSKYDPIIDQFLRGGHDLVEIDVKGRNPIYVKSQLRRRIKDRKLEIATSSAGSFVYLERISSQARA